MHSRNQLTLVTLKVSAGSTCTYSSFSNLLKQISPWISRYPSFLFVSFLPRFDPKAKDKGRDNSKAWCFLENVRDPEEPRSGCFPDVKWSSRDGRFWSSDACSGLPAPEYAAEGAKVKVTSSRSKIGILATSDPTISFEDIIDISQSVVEIPSSDTDYELELDDELELDVDIYGENGTDVVYFGDLGEIDVDLEIDSTTENQIDSTTENQTQTEYPISFSFEE